MATAEFKIPVKRPCLADISSQRTNHQPDVGGSGDALATFTRSQAKPFDWQQQCFLCEGFCWPEHRHLNDRNWSLVTVNMTDLFTKVLAIAQTIDDHVMQNRLQAIPNCDLVRVGARYHRKKNCIQKYYKKAEVKNKQQPAIRIVCGILINELSVPIIHEKKVFLLSSIRVRALQIAQERNLLLGDCRSANLKKTLSDMCNSITFYPQPGKSDLVCSRDISVGEVIVSLANQVQQERDEMSVEEMEINTSEEDIVHQACGIIKRRTKDSVKMWPKEEYFAPSELQLDGAVKYLDPLVYKFACWIEDDELFSQAITPQTVSKKAYVMACDITTLSSGALSPKHQGLAVHLHHKYGRRDIIDDMFDMGYVMSYTELRHFLTSAATKVATESQEVAPGIIMGSSMKEAEEKENLASGVADNWDRNERTVDGRKTTHSMANISVISITKGEPCTTSERLQRIPLRVFDTSSVPGGGFATIKKYYKPAVRPEPQIHPPPKKGELTDTFSTNTVKAEVWELTYQVCRYLDGNFPPWGPIHAILSNGNVPLSKIIYNPMILAPPTDYDTVYTTLTQYKYMARALKQKHFPVYFDMGLLPKALEIVWANPEEFKEITLFEGGMHLLFSQLSGIGKVYGDAGLRQLLCTIFSNGAVNKILSGHDFERGTEAMKLIHEVLSSQLLSKFDEWLKHKEIAPPNYERIKRFGNDLKVDRNELEKAVEEELTAKLDMFRMEGRNSSKTFQFWDDYLQNVSLPFLLFISSTREGNWKLHQDMKENMLPFCFISGRHIYAKYLTVQVLQMRRLPQELQEAFNKRNQFVARLSEGCFNGTWLDYTIEATHNRESKGSGGIIGLTMKGSALARWFLARPVTSEYSKVFQESLHHRKNPTKHHSMQQSNIKRWKQRITTMNAAFAEGHLINPFNLSNRPPGLVHLATGRIAPKPIEDSLCSAIETGKSMRDSFINERLIPTKDNKEMKSFYATLPKSTIKTMITMTKSVKVKNNNIIMDPETVYLRLLSINAIKQVPALRLHSFENAQVPLSLFYHDGSMITNTKSVYMEKLESILPNKPSATLSKMENIDAIVIDASAVFRMLTPLTMNGEDDTFDAYAEAFQCYVLKHSRQVCRKEPKQIHIVFDRYFDQSIKNSTREKRHAKFENQQHITPQTHIPKDWKNFLACSSNKSRLASLCTDHLLKHVSQHLRPGQTLYLSGGNGTVASMVTREKPASECYQLVSNQEEADGRIILHSCFAVQQGAKEIVVSSPDTDVLVLLVHHQKNIAAKKIYMLTGHENKNTSGQRFIPVHCICQVLSEKQQALILAVYCLTGCDSTSALHGHGKATAFRLLMKESDAFDDLQHLGEEAKISPRAKGAATKFVARMYGSKESVAQKSLNILRCKMATQKSTNKKIRISGKKLPPTDDSFLLHLMRVIIQLHIWFYAHIGIQEMLAPTDWGWQIDEQTHSLQPILMTQSCSPPELLNDLICNCVDGCDNDCICARNQQPCTPSCKCTVCDENGSLVCKNEFSVIYMEESDDEDDGDDDG